MYSTIVIERNQSVHISKRNGKARGRTYTPSFASFKRLARVMHARRAIINLNAGATLYQIP